MGKYRIPAAFRRRLEEQPFQLWADLECRTLKVPPPIDDAAELTKKQIKKAEEGIVPLSACVEVK